MSKWTDFTKGKMGPYMKEYGSHEKAIQALSQEYRDSGLGEKGKKELKESQARTKFSQRAATTNLKLLQRIQLPTQKLMSQEQYMLGQLFGHGDKFFGSKKMLPFAGTPDEEGSETWRSFGL